MLNSELNIRPGNLIAVCYSNYFRYAIFKCFGKYGNPHFYFIYDGFVEDCQRREESKRKPYMTYINRTSDSIVPVDRMAVPPEIMRLYIDASSYLQAKGYIKH